jgi:AcrR family transcriptional regulator
MRHWGGTVVVAAQNADLAVDPRGESTQTRILDSAEYLVSESGVNGASLRAIVAHAGVNTAAVHYHFGSKYGLLEAVFARRIVPIAEERLALLADCREGAGHPPLLHQIISAFLEPGMRGSHGGATFARLRARMAADASDETRALLAKYFDHSSDLFLRALADALPHLPARDLHWRFHFLLGTMVYTMANPGRIQALTGHACDPSDMDAALAYLVPFLAQGFEADPIPEAPISFEAMRNNDDT